MNATPLGDTDDSRIYIDKGTMMLRGERRFATDAEPLKVRDATGVASMRANREYDCRQKKYRVDLFRAWLRPLFEGDNVRPPVTRASAMERIGIAFGWARVQDAPGIASRDDKSAADRRYWPEARKEAY
jgi:hypothetical protein